jgi:hypothetical protein
MICLGKIQNIKFENKFRNFFDGLLFVDRFIEIEGYKNNKNHGNNQQGKKCRDF